MVSQCKSYKKEHRKKYDLENRDLQFECHKKFYNENQDKN